MTSNTGRLYPSDILVSVAGQTSKVMADHLTTVAKERLTTALGALNKTDMKALQGVIKLQLGLPG